MQQSDPFEELEYQQERERRRLAYIYEVAQRWEAPVQDGLQQLARVLWSDTHLLGLIPVHRFRLRSRQEGNTYVWWIEHDTEPYDKAECAAYRVQLTVDDSDEPHLIVQNGDGEYPVRPLDQATLNETLAHAGQGSPLVILREMGDASYD